MTFCDNSDFAPLVPLRDGDKFTEMEEIARGEDFIQAGVRPVFLLNGITVDQYLMRCRRLRWVLKRLLSEKKSIVCQISLTSLLYEV
jgi:hypothetical protein